jgi:hypothetical protein
MTSIKLGGTERVSAPGMTSAQVALSTFGGSCTLLALADLPGLTLLPFVRFAIAIAGAVVGFWLASRFGGR